MARGSKPPVGVAWEPPPINPDKPDWPEVARTLKRSKMRWLKVFEHGRYTWYSAVRQGHVQAVHPDKGFETTTTDNNREAEPRTCTLYMRYNPDRDAAKKAK